MNASDWWQTLYDDAVAELLLVRRDTAELDATVDFLQRELRLSPGSTAFDQCTGIGSLAVPLARRGIRIVGVEQAAAYVDRANRDAVGLPATFVTADARAYVPEVACDGAFCWGTSFGNAATDAENLALPLCVYNTLKPTARFALDYQNVPGIFHGFRDTLERTAPDGTRLVRSSRLDLAGGYLRQTWAITFPDGRVERRETAVRLYLPHVLGDMLTACGFEILDYFGGVRGEPLTLASPRCIVLARKPA